MDYKVGDRVKVEFEGTVSEVHRDSILVQPDYSPDVDDSYYVDHPLIESGAVTKIKPALPTKMGSVIKTPDDELLVLTGRGWHYVSGTNTYTPGAILRVVGDFTVEYEPDEED